MQHITVRKRIVEAISRARFLSVEEAQTQVNLGIVALVADRFMETVQRTLGNNAAILLDDFYSSFLGEFPGVMEDSTDGEYSIRFFGPEGGAQFSFSYDARIRKYQGHLHKIVASEAGVFGLRLIQTFQIRD